MVPEVKHIGWENLYLALPQSPCDGPSIVNLTEPDTPLVCPSIAVTTWIGIK
jgi:hypothetical protein